MDEKKILQLLCEYFNAAKLVTFMPEVWREGSGAIFMDESAVSKRFVDGSAEISVRFDLAIRSSGYAAGDRLAVLEALATLTDYAARTDFVDKAAVITPVSGAKLYGIYSDGAEYRSTYELRYVKEGNKR